MIHVKPLDAAGEKINMQRGHHRPSASVQPCGEGTAAMRGRVQCTVNAPRRHWQQGLSQTAHDQRKFAGRQGDRIAATGTGQGTQAQFGRLAVAILDGRDEAKDQHFVAAEVAGTGVGGAQWADGAQSERGCELLESDGSGPRLGFGQFTPEMCKKRQIGRAHV